MDSPSRRLLIPFVLLLVSLAGCATEPLRTTVPSQPGPAQRAEAALQRGDTREAARLYGAAADAATDPAQAARLRLEAADLWLELNETAAAGVQLARLPQQRIPDDLAWRRQLLEARLHLAADDAERALQLLEREPVPASLAAAWRRTRAEALARLGRPLEAARALAQWTASAAPAEREIAEITLWSLLGEIPMETLRATMPPPPDEFGGWLELAFLTRDLRLQPDELNRALQQWRARYPGHPAAARLLPEMLAHYRDTLRVPGQVAVLLPMTGELRAAAEAVYQGFTAAYYVAEGERPTVKVYDVGERGRHALAAYEEAVAAGADLVVGPLTKESLIMLASRGELPVPVLALNTLPDGHAGPDKLYQFGLPPEDEAWAAADLAAARHHQRAVLLLPQGEWGRRVGDAFTAAFEQQGGRVLEVTYYDAAVSDHSDPIRSALNLDASERRYRELRGVLRRDIEFEPYRRQDADVLFLGAYPREARLIRPQLRFFHAIDLPVLATSHVYSGRPDPADQDMDGVTFVDMPWLLAPIADDALSRDALARLGLAGGLPRLYALGIDAYRLMPYLDAMREHSSESLEGKTGVLSVDADGRVRRRLLCARFVNGKIVPAGQPQAYGERPEHGVDARTQR